MLPLRHCLTCMWQASELVSSSALSSYNLKQVTVDFPSVFIAQLVSQTVVLGHKAGLDSWDGDQTAPLGSQIAHSWPGTRILSVSHLVQQGPRGSPSPCNSPFILRSGWKDGGQFYIQGDSG